MTLTIKAVSRDDIAISAPRALPYSLFCGLPCTSTYDGEKVHLSVALDDVSKMSAYREILFNSGFVVEALLDIEKDEWARGNLLGNWWFDDNGELEADLDTDRALILLRWGSEQ